jgi:hypothetical protein
MASSIARRRILSNEVYLGLKISLSGKRRDPMRLILSVGILGGYSRCIRCNWSSRLLGSETIPSERIRLGWAGGADEASKFTEQQIAFASEKGRATRRGHQDRRPYEADQVALERLRNGLCSLSIGRSVKTFCLP